MSTALDVRREDIERLTEEEEARLEAILRAPEPVSFREFIDQVKPGYEWYWHCEVLADRLMDVVEGEIDRLMVFMPPRHGKALALDTPAPTPSGWSTVGDLQPGDTVFGGNGEPCRVVAKSPVWKDRQLYKVSTDDGDEIIADGQHEWRVRLCRKREVVSTRTTEWLWERRQRMSAYRRPMVHRQGALETPRRQLPVDPYTLGVWLGDGKNDSAFVTSGVTQDREHIRSEIEKGTTYSTRSHSDVRNFGVLGLQVDLRGCGLLGDKKVPDQYLRASPRQRRSLLQGLVDSDGHVSPDGQVEFCSTNRSLARAVRELVNSLGYKASLVTGRATIDGFDHGKKHRVFFYAPNAARLPRKRDRCIEPEREHRYIDVEKAGRGPTACIQVDSPDSTFLCGRTMLPTHNSELVSRLLPAYYLYRFPSNNVGLTSYGARLAVRDLSMQARSYYRHFGGELSEEASAKKQWRNPQGGEVWAAGVGGGITGGGFDLGIIDDPIKGAEQARSETHRQTNRDWYDAEFDTREEPGGAQIIVQTRWHEADLSGWLLDRESVEPEGWHIVHFQAIREELPDYPESCTVEVDPRDEGQALCPDRKPLEELEAYRNRRPYYFSALYQGQPRPREGGMFTPDHFAYLEPNEIPDRGEVVRYWDRASTSGGGDYTVGVKARWYELPGDEHRFVIEDVVRGQWGTAEREERFSAVVKRDGPEVKQWIEQEGGSSGQDAVRATAQRNPGHSIEGDPVRGHKEDRADPLASWGATSNIYLVRAPWNDAFVRELTGFPNARHDDQVDAAGGAYRKLAVTEDEEYGLFLGGR